MFFIDELRKALTNGVDIFLGFGYEDSQGNHKLFAGSRKALQALFGLKGKAGHFGGNLYIGQFNNHQKVLIQDREIVVCGSHNWLSNKIFRNKERSFIVEEPVLAATLFDEISELIKANPAKE